MKRALLLSASVVSAIALAAACGDSNTPAKNPQNASASAPPISSTVQVVQDVPNPNVPDPNGKLSGAALDAYNRGLGAFAVGNLQDAKKHFQDAIAADSKAHQAHFSLGVVQERLRDSGAAQSYRQAYTLVSDYEPAIVAHAMWLARKGQTSDAETLLNQKRAQLPKSAAVLATLAEVKSMGGDTGSAQKLAQDALKLNPDYRPAMVILARDHYRQRRMTLALYALEAILDGIDPKDQNPPRDPNNAEARLLRGLILRELGKRFAATEEFQKAVERRPDLVEARIQLASAFLEAGNADGAYPLLEGAVRYDAENVNGHLLLGDALRLQAKYADAKKELDWVAAKDPSMPQVHYDLGVLYLTATDLPGMTPKQRMTSARAALQKYQELRSRGATDDSDELLNQVKLKEAEIDAQNAPAPPPPPPVKATASAQASAKPATSAAPAAPADAGAPKAK